MTDMWHAEYTGTISVFQGCSALIRPHHNIKGISLVQFDRIGNRKVEDTELCHGWHEFPEADFDKGDD